MNRSVVVLGLLVVVAIAYKVPAIVGSFDVAKFLIGSPPPIEERYPKSPHDMPERVSTPLPELLASYEKMLVELGFDVAADLQPGLSDDQLEELERKYKMKLSSDMRDLYKWHNGSPTGGNRVFLYMMFVPLDQSLATKLKSETEGRSKDPRVAAFMDDWLAHRKSWIEILADGSGNGYFYDPDRINESSSFFYTAHDDFGYEFYPCIGNFIESLLETHRMGLLQKGQHGLEENGKESIKRYTDFVNQYGRTVH